MTTYIVFGIFGLSVLVSILINNQIVAKKNQVEQAFGSIEIYLKKRFDLIPNLIAMLNKYLAHEKTVIIEATKLRDKANEAISPQEKIETSNDLSKLMGGLNINVENYPELKADKQFANLQFNLTDIEDQISASRRAYNATVTSYNNKIQMFPASIIARVRQDKTNSLLEIQKADQKEVNINQLLNL